MDGRNHWRRALVLSVLIHLVILIGFGLLAPFAFNNQPPPDYIEMVLADNRTVQADSLPAQIPVGRPLPSSSQPAPEPQTAQNDFVDVQTNNNGPTAVNSGEGQAIAAAAPRGGGGPIHGGTEKAGIQPPRILQKTDPIYPEQARRQGWEGRVVVRLEVLPGGVAGSIGIERSSGYPLLDETAIQAVRHWRFIPAKDTVSGLPIPCITTIPLVFRLN